MRPLAAVLITALAMTGSAGAKTAPRPEHPLALALSAATRGDEVTANLLVAKLGDPLARKLVTWRFLTREDAEGPFVLADRFLKDNPGWPSRGSVQAAAERSLPSAWSEAQVLAWLERHPPVTHEGKLRRVRTLYTQGREEELAAAVRRLWIDDDLPYVQQGPFLQRFGHYLRPVDETARFERLVQARRWSDATRQANRLGGGYPAFVLALNRLAAGQIDLERAVAQVPSAFKNAPALRYEAARYLRRERRPWAVFALLDHSAAAIPLSKRWWRLRHWTARRLFEEDAPDKAYRLLLAHGQEDGRGFAEAEWLAGWIALRSLGKPQVALEHFRRMSAKVSTPVSAARGAYWSARAAASAGRAPEAEVFYRAAARHGTTFYGQLAARQLGRVPELGRAATRPSPVRTAAFERRELVRAARLLAGAGRLGLARAFVAALERQAETVEDKLLVADLARSIGRPDLALQIARRLRNKGVVLTDRLFPRGGGLPKIRHRLDPDLVHAVIRQESGFYTKAVSHAGARGLMQLMPATARQTARREGLSFARSKLTSQPGYNMRLGTAYLTQMLERFDGSLPLALAAYNGGPRNVSRWIERFGAPGPSEAETIDWIESIPFAETRNYVHRIIETIEVYRLLDGSTRRSDLLSPKAKSIN